MVPQPRGALDDEVPVRRRVYADGTALVRYLVGAPCRSEWLAWTAVHEADLVTTPLGVTELLRSARPRGVEAHGIAHDVAARVEVVRFSDQTLRAATHVAGVLPPFAALHVGAAVAHPDVRAVATYDLQLARVATLYALEVVSPGMPPRWWEDGAGA
ncbi:hypothetical protein Cch01nite_39610 [Cellulomonas chitinilytica]|uniref:PIN domain-containing protein n=1 Tax=Cellulomonas chitinilytica TaxID=398759 RepID=A0A919P6W8_9CELL|nr:hypothetical protein Cch01nite_39610 [Cellulomonas chitinilytica]